MNLQCSKRLFFSTTYLIDLTALEAMHTLKNALSELASSNLNLDSSTLAYSRIMASLNVFGTADDSTDFRLVFKQVWSLTQFYSFLLTFQNQEWEFESGFSTNGQ